MKNAPTDSTRSRLREKKSVVIGMSIGAATLLAGVLASQIPSREPQDEALPTPRKVRVPEFSRSSTFEGEVPTASSAAVQFIVTSSRAKALAELQDACAQFRSAPIGPADAVYEARSAIIAALRALAAATSSVSGDPPVPMTLSDACQIIPAQISQIVGAGAKRDVRMATLALNSIEDDCAYRIGAQTGPEQEALEDEERIRIADCEKMPAEAPAEAEECKRKLNRTIFESCIMPAIAEAQADCKDLVPKSPKAKKCIADTARPSIKACWDKAQPQETQCEKAFGQSQSDCKLDALSKRLNKQLKVMEARTALTEKCRAETANDEYGIDLETLLVQDAEHKAAILGAVQFSVKGGHVPSSQEIDQYIELIRHIVLNEKTMTGALREKLGNLTMEQTRKRYIDDVYSEIEALAKKNPSNAQLQDAVQRFNILKILSSVFDREEP